MRFKSSRRKSSEKRTSLRNWTIPTKNSGASFRWHWSVSNLQRAWQQIYTSNSSWESRTFLSSKVKRNLKRWLSWHSSFKIWKTNSSDKERIRGLWKSNLAFLQRTTLSCCWSMKKTRLRTNWNSMSSKLSWMRFCCQFNRKITSLGTKTMNNLWSYRDLNTNWSKSQWHNQNSNPAKSNHLNKDNTTVGQ